jgi:putative adenylate-forming enzyme
MSLSLASLAWFVAARWRFHRLRGSRLLEFQDHQARQTVHHALRRSPFYGRLFADRKPAEWATLPTVDKRAMMDSFDTFNTHGISRDEAMTVALRAETERNFRPTIRGLTVGLSSGTSGHRGLFLVSPSEQAAWAGTLLARLLPGFRRRGYRIALFLRSNSNLYESLGGRWLRFRYHDLMTPLDQAIEALNADPPDFLAGPPSLLGFLADAFQKGKLHARPEWLVSVAEVLEPQDEEKLRAIFGVPVLQIYQCTEGLLAASCHAGSLHLQEDLVAVQLEPLDSLSVRFTPIVTDLWRRTQPIIRYRLNDVVSLDSRPCRCGSAFRVLSRIEGRCDDVCYFEQRGGGLRPIFPDTIRRMILLADAGLLDYQAFQESPARLRIHLDAPAAEFSLLVSAVCRSVESIATQYDCLVPAIVIERGLEPVAQGAKRRRVRRLFSPA